MWVTYEDGSHLSRSQKTPGDYSPLTRDDGTNELGHVTLRPLAEDEDDSPTDPQPVFIYVNDASASTEDDEFADAVASLVALAAALAVVTAAPHIRRWWDNTAFPALRSAMASTRRMVTRAPSGDSPADGPELPVVLDAAPADASHDVEVAGPGISMSMTEWQERFRLMLLAEAFRDEQWKLLSTARVEGDHALPVLQRAMAQLSPQEVAERIRSMLEAKPHLLDERASTELMQILSGAPIADREYAPLRIEKIDEASAVAGEEPR
jgi:hypothetical protein